MDSLRSAFGALDDASGEMVDEDEVGHESPPPGIGNDERRMQVRAYSYWASLLDNRNFPNVEDLDPDRLPDFGPHGVLLDFSRGVDDPSISFLGERLAQECGADGLEVHRLSDVPARSLLSRITDHYMQILANQAPIGFEAEFVNQRGMTILYRGILLPFSSDDDTIDFIYGVINWKELADPTAADELLLEIDQALDREPAQPARRRVSDLPLSDWADGPGSAAANDSGSPDDLPRPSFGLGSLAGAEGLPSPLAEGTASPALAHWLAEARAMAAAARDREDRTRAALYDAISRAYDFALAACGSPDEFAALIEEAGLSMQERAPMTPVVKLVFGADYDKTRLTEYATALVHAQRLGLPRGTLGDYLRRAEGGLKGVVTLERAFRRERDGGSAQQAHDLHRALAQRLRSLEPAGIPAEGREFGLVMIRRMPGGKVEILGEVPENLPLIEKAARELVG